MGKLTDLEICKCIAEIEFGKHSDNWFWSVEGESDTAMVSAFTGDGIFGSYSEYNPLTDDALCFKLMIKYQASTCFVRPAGSYIGNGADLTFKGNPNKAICMAIIEAHK